MNTIRRAYGRAVALVVLVAAGLVALAVPATAAGTCQSTNLTNPTTLATYTATVCITQPSDGATLTGNNDMTGTISFTGTSPGVQRMVWSLNGSYLLTDYSSPYTFSLHTARFVDGTYTLGVHAMLRDTNVTPDTTVTVNFNNGVTTPPVNTNTFTPPQGNPPAAGTTYTVAAAGDGAGGEASETAVTNLMAGMNPNLTLYLGDVYEKGTPTEFDNWFGLNQPGNTFYGRFRDITLPTIGNHEYTAGQAPGYFDYWDNTPHYYSVNRNGWHIISLDTNSAFNQTAVGTPQYDWLSNDLQNNTQACTLVFFHQPYMNIGDEGPSTYLQPMWQLMASKGVDLVINGHDHTYQRYVPVDGNGNPSASGITEIINGAGGHALGAFPLTDSRLAASAQQFGVLKLGLNSAGASYAFVGTNGAIVDNGSTKCDTSRLDSVSPTTPTNLVASSVYKTRIDLNWTEGTDNVGVVSYRIFRDGSLLDTVPATDHYSDMTVAPGSSHSYQVRAVDAANNASALSNTSSATTPTVSVLFHDGFETGDMSRWQNPGGTTNPPNAGLTVQSDQVFAGSYAARALSTDGTNGASAWKTLSQTQTNLYTVARFRAASHSTSVNLFRLRAGNASSSPIVTMGLSTTNRLTMRNDGGTTPATITSATSAAAGVWHTVQLHATVNGTSSATEVWLDGTPVSDLTLPTADLGSNAIAKLELGDPGSATTAKLFDVAFDEVAYDTEFIGDLAAPTTPTNLTATAHSGLAVDLAWNASTDDVGISGYDIYRNGALLTSEGPANTFRDTSVQPGTSYTYQVLARDASGNQSGLSNAVTVQTSDIFADGFESGDLSAWTTSSGLVAQQALVDTGSWAARATSDGTAGASAQVTLDSTLNEVYYRLRFDVVSQGANPVTLARVRTAQNGALVTVSITAAGKLAYRNEVTGVTTVTGTTVTPGTWHELQLHVTMGDTGQVELWYDGLQAISQAEALGTNPIGRLELGEPGIGRTFDVAFDGVLASPSFVTDTAVPTPPTNLRVTSQDASSISLAWDPATDDVGVTAYRVIRDGVVLGDVDGATLAYTDSTIQPNQTYTYRVYALDAVGHRSDGSNSVTVQSSDTLPPDAPTGLTAHAVAGANEVDLSWTAATDNRGVTGYKVYRSDSTGALATLGTTTSYADTSVASTTTYTYTVTALDAAGNESVASAPATLTTSDTQPPSAPGTPVVTAVSDTSLSLSWGAATDAGGVASYAIYRDGGATAVGTVAGSTTTFTDNGPLAGDSTHSYTVKATDTSGNVGPASAAGSGTTTVFMDGFETGNLSKWSSGNLVVGTTLKYAGTYAARATSPKNTAVFAVKNLPSTYTDLTASAQVYLGSGKQDGADLLRFRTSTGTNLLVLGFASNKKLTYTNNVRNTTVSSNTSLPVGVWSQVKVRVVVNGNSSQVTVWFNGTQVAALSGTIQLGTTPIGQLVAGNNGTGRQYDFYLDDVKASRQP